MDKKQKMTILKTMASLVSSSVLIASFAMQPTGSMKQAVHEYNVSTATSVIQNSALAEQGSLSVPNLSKSFNSDESTTHGGLTVASPFVLPDYVSSGHMTTALDAEGDDVDLITQEQGVSREITLSNGETYTEVYGFKDELGTYYDQLPENAAVGIVNTPGSGDGEGATYQQFTSRDNQTLTFSSKVSSSAVHGTVNSGSTNGATKVYDASRGTWHTVSTGTTSGVVGDGTGGSWSHSRIAAGSSWPRVGWNPPSGSWNSTQVRNYAYALYDHYITNSSSYSSWTMTSGTHGWIEQQGGGTVNDNFATRSEFGSYAFNLHANGWSTNYFYYLIFNQPGSGLEGNVPSMSGARTLGSSVNVPLTTSNMFSGTIATVSGSNGTWEYYSGNRENEWVYTGPVYYSSSPDQGGSEAIYGDVYSWTVDSSGTGIYDQDYNIYQELPRNAEKQAVLGNNTNQGDFSGNTYYQGDITPNTSSVRIWNAFTADLKPEWDENVHNAIPTGDGSGRTYERALYYYDSQDNLLDSLPAGEFLYGDSTGGLFNSVGRSTDLGTTGQYEGLGITEVVNWISDNADTFTISQDFRASAADLNVEFVVTEIDTKQKRLIVALQAAIEFLSGATSNTAVADGLVNFARIVDISDAERNSIASAVSSTSISSITSAVSEGYRESVEFFGHTFNMFGTSADTTSAAALLNSSDIGDFFAISSDIGTLAVETASGIEYVYYDITGDTLAEQQLSLASVTEHLDPTNALLQPDLLQHFTLDDWGVSTVTDRTQISNVRYVDFDYDKSALNYEVIVHVGDKMNILPGSITFTNSYLDQIQNTLLLDEIKASANMLAEQPLLTSGEYTSGSETDVDSNTASFALRDSFDAKFPDDVTIDSISIMSPPTEDQTNVGYEFTIEYEGHTFTHTQYFDFAKTRSQKYIEEAVLANQALTSTVTEHDRTIQDLTSRVETFQPFEDFLVADGNTSLRMTFENVTPVGGLDKDSRTIDFSVDITMGTYTSVGQVFTLNLDRSINEALIDNLSGDDIIHTTPGVVSVVDDLTDADWNDSKWWTVQSVWLDIVDITGIAVLGNFQKIDERNFQVDLEVIIGNERKTVTVTQQVGFDLNFAPVLDESTTGITDPDRLQDLIDYMANFDEQASVFYIGTFINALDVAVATPAELLAAWEATVSTFSGNAFIASVGITDINAVTKYDRDISFSITLEDSRGNTRVFDKVYSFTESAVEMQFDDIVISMLNTSQDITGQLTDDVMTSMRDINDWVFDLANFDLLDTLRVVSVTNTGKTSHITFEFGYSGHIGSDSKELSIDLVFNRRADQTDALSTFGLEYLVAELSNYYDPNDVDGNGNDWTNVEQNILDEVIRIAALTQLRDDMEDEITSAHSNIYPNLWADLVALRTAIEDIATESIVAVLQADIVAGNTTRVAFVNDEWVSLRNNKIEDMILSVLASDWKLASTSDVITEILKYNSSFNIQDYYLLTVDAVIDNTNFDTVISLEIAFATLLPHILDITLDGIVQGTDPDYYNAVSDATNNNLSTAYSNVIGTSWVGLDSLIDFLATEVSQVIIDTQISLISGVLNSTTTETDRTLDDLIKDLTIFSDEEIKVVSYNLENGTEVDKDANSFGIELFLTFGAVISQREVLTLQLDMSINEAIIDAITEYSFSLEDANKYPTIDYMLEAMGEDIASGGSGTITDVSLLTLNADFVGQGELTFTLDPNNTLVAHPGSLTVFNIGLILTAGNTVENHTITITVGEAIDFTSPDYQDGGAFDFSQYFILSTSTYDNPYDLHQIGDEARNHIDIDDFLKLSLVTIQDLQIVGNDNVDIFSRQFVATFTLQDGSGNIRSFVDQPIVLSGKNKAEIIMENQTVDDIALTDQTLVNGQLTDDILNNILPDLSSYTFENDIDVLNDFQMKDLQQVGKFVTVVFIVGYDDGAGQSDHVEYTYVYEFAYRADVAWSLDYYGLNLSLTDLGITWTEDQRTGNVEQDEIDNIVIAGLQNFLIAEYEGDLQTFVDAGIFTSIEIEDVVRVFLDMAKIDDIANDGQSMSSDEVITKYRLEIMFNTVNKALDSISVSLLKATDWAEVATRFPTITSDLEASITDDVNNGVFIADTIEPTLAKEVAIAIAPEVENIAIIGAPGIEGWLQQLIGSDKVGWMWDVHMTFAEQLSEGFNDAPDLSDEIEHIHDNRNSVNGWFLDEISNLTSFASLDDYIIHLSTVIARTEIQQQITESQLAAARASLKSNISSTLQDLIDENIFALEEIDRYLDILLYVEEDGSGVVINANYAAIFTPDEYFTANTALIISEQLTLTTLSLVENAGYSSMGEFASITAIYILVNGQDLDVEEHKPANDTADTVDEYRDMHNHYIAIFKHRVYTDAFETYLNDAQNNIVGSYKEFLESYVSRMDVHLSGLEGIEYDDQSNMDTQVDFVAMRVDQIQNMPDIEQVIIDMIDNINLDSSILDDTPYKDLLQFTITQDELYAHLYSQAMNQILNDGGVFDIAVEDIGNQGNSLNDTQIARAQELLDGLMTDKYPGSYEELVTMVNTAIIFAIVDEDFYVHIISRYVELTSTQESGAPAWNPKASEEETKEALEIVLDRIFEELADGSLLIGDALNEILESRDEIAIDLAWIKYEEAFRDIFEQQRDQDETLSRITIEELGEYTTDKLLRPSLSYYIQELLDADRVAGTSADVPSTATMLVHLQGTIDGTIDYAQEMFGQLLDEIAETSKATRQDVLTYSSIMSDVIELAYDGHLSEGGTSTEIKALRTQLGKYVFELIIEVTEKPDPEQSLNGWLIPFAAMITKTEDYSKISQIIQDKIDAGEEIDYENWGFENVADIMDALIDSTEDQETYNAATGKILMDKFIRSVDSSSNKWSTTMWMGPVPLRMTYGTDGNIASMQTVLMDREDTETITSIGLSTLYNQEELTLRLGMEDGTIVYIRYVEDVDGNINVILQRLDSEGSWLTSEMYREQDIDEDISKKNYQIFRDSNLDSFEGIGSEFEDEMITIFGESPVTAQMSINESTTRNTVDHVWGTNPTVGSSTDTGDAESARALVTKDDAGKTHIQMHQKDIRITNVTNSMTASITAGGFTLMWLIWTFLGGIAGVASGMTGRAFLIFGRKERKQLFLRRYPLFAGASIKTIMKLRIAYRVRNRASKEYNAVIKENDPRFKTKAKREELEANLEKAHANVERLEAIGYAEAEATRYKRSARRNIKNIDVFTNDNIERATKIPQILNQRTALANQLVGGKFVQNTIQEHIADRNNAQIPEVSTEVSAGAVKEQEVVEHNVAPNKRVGPTLRQLEDTIKKIVELNTKAIAPEANNPQNGIDFSPFTRLGLDVDSVMFKRADIDKNVKEQTLALIMSSNGREFIKDVKVTYKRSVNEDIILNIDKYHLDITRLKRFDFTTDEGFNEDGIINLFKVNAPGATTRLVKGSLETQSKKEYSGKLEITVGKLSTIIPFKARL